MIHSSGLLWMKASLASLNAEEETQTTLPLPPLSGGFEDEKSAKRLI